MSIDLRRLEIFSKVIELRSFTKAAEAVYLSQPTVSEHVKALEEILGERLVDRLGKEVLPTPAGQILYRYAQQMLEIRDKALQALAEYKGKLAGRLNFGASTIPGTYILPHMIGEFKALYPNIYISLTIGSTAEIVTLVVGGHLEFGIVGSKWDDSRLLLEPLLSDELALVVYPDHPWSNSKEISLQDLYGEPFILRQPGSGTRKVMEDILSSHGFELSGLKVVAEVGSTEAVKESIRARIGISILSRQAVDIDLKHGLLKEVKIKGVRFQRPFYLIRRAKREFSPVSSAFVAHMRRSWTAKGEA